MKKRVIIFVAMILFFVSFVSAVEYVPNNIQFVPGTAGFADTQGPWGGIGTPVIYIVDTLIWDDGQAVERIDNYGGTGITVYKGSLQKCLTDYFNCALNQGRIILFEVSGTINQGGNYIEQRLRQVGVGAPNYIWIVGQSAPPPGITLYNIKLIFQGSHNIVQHLRFRLDDNGLTCLEAQNHKGLMFSTYDTNGDGIPDTGFNYSVHNIVDHCSFSYGIDSLFWANDYSTNTNNIFSYALGRSVHPKSYDYRPIEGNTSCAIQYTNTEHSKGMGVQNTDHLSLISNLFAFNNDRNPMTRNTKNIYLANNLMYGCHDFRITLVGGYGAITATMIGNVAHAPSWEIHDHFLTFYHDPDTGAQIYLEDNKCDTATQSDPNIWDCIRYRLTNQSEAEKSKVLTPVDTISGFTPIPSSEVENYILNNVGAFPLYRDVADSDLMNKISGRTGSIINKPEDLPTPFPVLQENIQTLTIPVNPHADDDTDGYTNLEEWIHGFSCDVEGPQSPSCLVAPFVCGSADSDFSGVVSITELINYITEWKAGNVNINDLINGITEWKNGC